MSDPSAAYEIPVATETTLPPELPPAIRKSLPVLLLIKRKFVDSRMGSLPLDNTEILKLALRYEIQLETQFEFFLKKIL